MERMSMASVHWQRSSNRSESRFAEISDTGRADWADLFDTYGLCAPRYGGLDCLRLCSCSPVFTEP